MLKLKLACYFIPKNFPTPIAQGKGIHFHMYDMTGEKTSFKQYLIFYKRPKF